MWHPFLAGVCHIFCHFHNCCHPPIAQASAACSVLLSSSGIVPCFIVPTHLAHETLGKPRNLFLVTKASANHVQQSPECKAFVLAKQTVIEDASTMQSSLKCVTMDGTAHLFKKQRLRLNPTFSTQQQYHTHHTLTHGGIEDESMDADNDNVSLADDNSSQSGSITSGQFHCHWWIFRSWRFCWEKWFCWHYWSPCWEWLRMFYYQPAMHYILDVLADSMECPDYAFQEIMEWAHKCYYEAGFDFNPKCKHAWVIWLGCTMHYIMQPEQMLPHLEPVELPDPLPYVKTMNVICYDFVPQVLSILQDKKIMSANNLVLDPNNPLAMYKPHDNWLGEALSWLCLSRYVPPFCYQSIQTTLLSIDMLHRWCPNWFLVSVWCGAFCIHTGHLTHAACSKAKAWRPLGYVQQLKSNLQSDKCKLCSSGKARNYHAQLQAMLKSLQRVQTGEDTQLQKCWDLFVWKMCKGWFAVSHFVNCSRHSCCWQTLWTLFQLHRGCSACNILLQCFILLSWIIQTLLFVNLSPGMQCIRLLLLEVKKNVQQCPNTSVTMHLPILTLVILCTRFWCSPMDPMHSVCKGVMAWAMSLILIAWWHRKNTG